LPGTMFRVKRDNDHEVLAHISGKMRKRFVRLTTGDRVRLEMSQYDPSKARVYLPPALSRLSRSASRTRL
jgi:translation initiation factor IF-1